MIVLRNVILVVVAIAGERRLTRTAGNLIEFAAYCDAYGGDGRCLGSDSADPADFIVMEGKGNAAIPAGITFRLSYPGRTVNLAHRV